MKAKTTAFVIAQAVAVVVVLGLISLPLGSPTQQPASSGSTGSDSASQEPAVSTTTVTTTVPPGPNTNVYAPDDGVDLEGCSLITKTCTFLIQNFNLMDGYGINLGRDGMCVTVTYTPASISSFVNEAAGCTTPSNSTYIANNGATTIVTAVFSGWSSGAGSNQGPTAGESVWGCILYTSGDGFGCLAFVGVFTSSQTSEPPNYLTTTQVITSTVTITVTSP